MGTITDLGNSVYRDYVTDGVPWSGLNDPAKSDIRRLFSAVEVAIGAAQAGLAIVPTIAQRDAFYATAANRGKLVYVNNNNGSATDAANGVYEYVGSSARIAQSFYQGLAVVVQPLLNEVEMSATEADNSAAAAQASAVAAQSSADLARAAVILAYGQQANGKGLLYRSDNTLTGWTGDTSTWSSNAKPLLLAYGPSAVIAQTPGPKGSSDFGGDRETFLFIDTDGTWYEFYGAGNGSGLASDPLSPWRPQYSKSVDGGVTWTKLGDVPGISRNHGYDSGQWPAADNLFLDLRGGTYYLHRLTAGSVYQNEVCGGPYTSAVWSATNINGPYTFVRNTVSPGPSGSFDARDAYASCMVYSAGNYYLFYSATTDSADNPQWHVGVAVGTSPAGPFTKTGTQVLPDSIRGQAENPEVFYSQALGCWVMLTNQINKTLGLTDGNRAFFSSSLTDWSAATYVDFQKVSPLDGKFAVGLPRAIRLSDNSVPVDGLGNIGITYDTDPTDGGASAYHKGRRIKYAQLEPSTRELTTSGAGTSYSTVFADDFSTESVGVLGGQNGWLDGSGSNAKPQVTSAGKLDMGTASGASLVYRAGTAATTRLSATIRIGASAGIGFAIGYRPGVAHWRFEWTPGFLRYIYVDADGTETVIAQSSATGISPQDTDFSFVVTITNGTITTVSNGQTMTATITNASQLATLNQAGGVAIRNGSTGNATRLVDNYKVERSIPSTMYLPFNHSSFVANFAITPNAVSGSVDLFYRMQASTGVENCYRLRLDTGRTETAGFASSFSKIVNGAATVLNTSGTAFDIRAVAGRPMRIKIVVEGQRHRIYVEGEKQLDLVDTTYPYGVAVGIGKNGTVNAAVRGLTFYRDERVTITGTEYGKTYTLRGAGGMPLASVTATGSQVVFSASHYPAATITEGTNTLYAPSGGIWGGDVFG